MEARAAALGHAEVQTAVRMAAAIETWGGLTEPVLVVLAL